MLQEQHADFQNRSPFEIGCMNAVVQLDEIKKTLDQGRRFRGKYLLVLAEENLNLISWDSQDHAMRKQLVQMSHAVFAANPNSRSFFLGEKHDSISHYIAEFKSQKPCIWGCDAHGFEQRFLEPDSKRYCWIKGEVSWEGLKQILYEPNERVRIQEHSPEYIKSYFTLEEVQVEETEINPTLSINATQVELNPNLVTIIGGRGSGKTALLDLIASCFAAGHQLEKNETSFYHRLYEQGRTKGAKSDTSAPIPIRIRFKSGDSFEKRVGGDEEIFEQADILYLTQNHIDDYTANPSKLYSHIIELVFEQNPDGRKQYKFLSDQALEIRRQLQSLNLQIDQLQDEIRGKLEEEEQTRKQKEGEKSDLEKRFIEQESHQQGQTEKIDLLTNELQSLKDHREHLEQVIVLLKTLDSSINDFLPTLTMSD